MHFELDTLSDGCPSNQSFQFPVTTSTSNGVTRVGVTRGRQLMMSPYFFLTTFFNNRLLKVMTFLAVVSSPLPSSHVVFLNSATTKLILFGCHLPDGPRGGPPPLPLVTSLGPCTSGHCLQVTFGFCKVAYGLFCCTRVVP